MVSTAKKGSYYKSKTKKWLEEKGYQVCFLERMFMLFINGKTIPIKRDQFASDLLAMSKDEIIFVQVKTNKKNVSSAYHEFDKYTFPPFAKKWIVIWIPRIKTPEVIPY